MGKSKIEWTDRTWNPVTGCTKVSAGCANCYAERMTKRFYPGKNFNEIVLHEDRLNQPLRWRKPSKVFVCSMSDLFHDDVPGKFIIDTLSVMAEASKHTFLLLTKRPEQMKDVMNHCTVANDVWLQTTTGVSAEPPIWPLPNVWLGVTAENQEQADKRIPILLQTPAAKRFVSVEPMLGPVDLGKWLPIEWSEIGETWIEAFPGKHCYDTKLHWVICGGESGPGARPMHPDWARSLRDQCTAAGVPFLFKQWGEFAPFTYDPRDPGRVLFANPHMFRIGKKAAGRLLDGKLWDQYPGETK